jgi:hypothetical protein
MLKDIPKTQGRRKCRAGMSIRAVDKRLVNKRVLNAISRDVNHILIASSQRQLSTAESNSMINYAKLLKDLIKDDAASIASMSDEELERIANGSKASKSDPGAEI